jgi:transposase-like protein
MYGQSGKTVPQIAQELGLTSIALHNWVKKTEINQNPAAKSIAQLRLHLIGHHSPKNLSIDTF